MSFEVDIGFTSQAGAKAVNEDFAGAMLPEEGLEGRGVIAAIADGVSAGGMGQEAAQTTVTTLVRDYYGTPPTWETSLALDRLIAAQNAWLAATNRRREPAVGMTTLTALVLRGQAYALAHVGDTRAYLLREGQVTQLTTDHVMPHADFRHQLLRAVGAEDRLVVDYVEGELRVGDVFVLTTDGVHGAIRLRQLAELAEIANAQVMSASLVEAALQGGSTDNATALVVRVLGLLETTEQDVNRAAQALPVPVRLKPGDTLDGLRVVQVLVDDGVDLVYHVRGPRDQGDYALKTLPPSHAHDPEECARLAHEAWLARSLQSSLAAARLPRLHEKPPGGKGQTALYLLYDWHPGETLQQMLNRRHRFSPEQAVALASQALQALDGLHRQGVVHRAVQPAHLHCGEDGVLRLLNLGLAMSGREPASMLARHAGSPSYTNPEQWGFALRGSVVDTRAAVQVPDAASDLFALGVTLYQLLTGKLPYGEVLPHQSEHYQREPLAPSHHNPEVPLWLDQVVLQAVARDKERRFRTAEEFLFALEGGAAQPLPVSAAAPLGQRDPTLPWKLLLGVSVLFNLLFYGLSIWSK